MTGESEKESQHGGDPKTVNPRMYCTNCDEWIYLTWQRGFEQGVITVECDCNITFPDGSLPEVWERAF